jgi:hypothetical protein
MEENEDLREIAESPAYPLSANGEFHTGMTLREYFAAQAMTALLNRDDIGSYRHEDVAMMSVRQADELIKALHK